MNKLIKLIILIILSLSVYYIYNYTNNSKYTIMNLGDRLSTGIDNSGRKEKSYIDYFKEYQEKENDKVELKNTYSNNSQNINKTLLLIENNPKIKRELIDSDILIITLGYNDLVYELSIEDVHNEYILEKKFKKIKKEYNSLIEEITKYYHKEIIVIGYYKLINDNSYINNNIVKLNNILKSNKKVNYIDTYNLLINDKYFSNKGNNYPNNKGNKEISKKIISKILEKV